jgi:hypothetical protein
VLSEIFVLTRVSGIPYGVRIIFAWDGNRFTDTERELAVSPRETTVFFAGSCHDNIVSPQNGDVVPAPPSAEARQKMDVLRGERTQLKTVEEFVKFAERYEVVLTQVSADQNKCYVGPPYDSATWAKGDAGWKVQYHSRCNRRGATLSQEAPSTHGRAHP